MTKNTIISIVVATALIILAIVLTSGKTNNQSNNSNGNSTGTTQEATVNNVSIVDGKQIIEINAKGGYTPRKSIAKAGIPTVLRFNTNGTFDCSSSVRIPSMNIFKSLPQSGSTDIDLNTQPAGTLNGSCGMGMYPFEITFQ
jgi:plastocyanin domain-containing protein